jgi:predicted transcriptional regulator
MKGIREMISNLSCENILECFYGLNEVDIAIYSTLLRKKEARIEEISSEVNRGENAVYKSLQKLVVSGVATREKRVLGSGGYYYIYRPIPPDAVAEDMERMLEVWYRRIKETIREFSRKGVEVWL